MRFIGINSVDLFSGKIVILSDCGIMQIRLMFWFRKIEEKLCPQTLLVKTVAEKFLNQKKNKEMGAFVEYVRRENC